jgi:hypothetical protein
MSWNALAVYLASLSVPNTVRSYKVLKGSNGYSFEEGYHHQFEFPYFELDQLHGETLQVQLSPTLTLSLDGGDRPTSGHVLIS